MDRVKVNGSGEPPAKRFKEDVNNSAGLNQFDKNWKSWDSEQVGQELEKRGLEEVAHIFRDQDIVGRVLPQLSDDRLKQMGIHKFGLRLQVKEFIEQLVDHSIDTKIFNDPIHGHIELHPLCVKIIDTPQFQRLRFLKQLGTCYFVYPGATHNRFEHSIGVCHLAGRLVRELQRRQPQLGITDCDILCVEIAGLCHDLGHGPFSHLFDGTFIPHVRPDCNWKHEDGSRLMLEYLIEDNELMDVFERYGLDDTDIEFIKEQVAGAKGKQSNKKWPYEGRPKGKSFLYEIVANKRNGIDVDKWDYFARDCHMLGIKNNFDHNRCIHFARVIEVDGHLQICSREKEANNLYDMFHTRLTLHRRAYQHRVTKILDSMITEALVKANDYIFFEGKDGKPKKMSEAIDDMHAYIQLTDYVFLQIYHSNKPELEESRKILENLMKRNLYKCVGQTQLNSKQVMDKDQVSTIKEEVIQKMDQDELESSPFTSDDMVVNLVYLDYGMKDQNPIDKVRFYSKNNPNEAVQVRKDQISQILPESFSEQQILVYHKKPTDKRSREMLARAFVDWCKDKDYPLPKDSEWTPCKPSPVNEVTPEKKSEMRKEVSASKCVSRLSF